MNSVTIKRVEASRTLPPNGVWDKSSAPADRFQALGEALQAVQEDVFEKLNGKGNGAADPKTIQAVQAEFELLRSDLQNSAPAYPDPKAYIAGLLGKCGRMYSWTIIYHSGSQSGPVLAQFTNVADQERNFWAYRTSDQEGDRVSALADGVKKLEDYATMCLQDARPFSDQSDGGILDKRKRSDVLTGMFSREASDLDSVKASAASVKSAGIFETAQTDCGDGMVRENLTAARAARFYNSRGELSGG